MSTAIESVEQSGRIAWQIFRVILAVIGFVLAIFGMLYAADQICAKQIPGVLKATIPLGIGTAIVVLALIMEPDK
jgi:hypothetical protein